MEETPESEETVDQALGLDVVTVDGLVNARLLSSFVQLLIEQNVIAKDQVISMAQDEKDDVLGEYDERLEIALKPLDREYADQERSLAQNFRSLTEKRFNDFIAGIKDR